MVVWFVGVWFGGLLSCCVLWRAMMFEFAGGGWVSGLWCSWGFGFVTLVCFLTVVAVLLDLRGLVSWFACELWLLVFTGWWDTVVLGLLLRGVVLWLLCRFSCCGLLVFC